MELSPEVANLKFDIETLLILGCLPARHGSLSVRHGPYLEHSRKQAKLPELHENEIVRNYRHCSDDFWCLFVVE